MKTFPSTDIRNVIALKSGVGFSDIEKGVSTVAGSGELMVAVSIRKIRMTANVSTIGVMSILGDLCGILIFGIFSVI